MLSPIQLATPPEARGIPRREWMRQAEEQIFSNWYQSAERKGFYLKHDAVMRARYRNYLPPSERAVATKRDAYGKKSA